MSMARLSPTNQDVVVHAGCGTEVASDYADFKCAYLVGDYSTNNFGVCEETSEIWLNKRSIRLLRNERLPNEESKGITDKGYGTAKKLIVPPHIYHHHVTATQNKHFSKRAPEYSIKSHCYH
ncbi:hypothetical protein Tcan_06747 [Toxocara canis]|uniref:Uncharacterized protein n=1 Tax=Toxocara canis TaxID=6265 RepID=A0A0B2UUC9_TOXCA|nr:hypothetical protein Tcan_06747 [Toxocara canis]